MQVFTPAHRKKPVLNNQPQRLRVLITGTSGTVAGLLSSHLLAGGHQVFGISRNPHRAAKHTDPRVAVISWRQLSAGFLATNRINAIINCAGAPMIQRWDHYSKADIITSRLHATRDLYALLRQLPAPLRPECIITASSVAIYSSCTTPVDEGVNPVTDRDFFQSQVWQQLEAMINGLHVPRVRTVIARIGVVIGPHPMLRTMLRLSRCFLGTVVGSGTQQLTWISHRDLVRALEYLLLNRHLSGVFNVVAPQAISAAEFSQGIARSVSRPVLLRCPGGLLRLLLGELAGNFLSSADVRPARLSNAGFNWSCPVFDQAALLAAKELGFEYCRPGQVAAAALPAVPYSSASRTEP